MLKPDINYKIIDGRIKTRSLEVHIVDHCNLSCAECCSLSPFLPKRFVSPDEMEHDLRLAEKVVAPTYLKLVGGEPLLHPQLLECLRVAKRLELAEVLSVTTNGLFIKEMADEYWDLIDAMTLSIYPAPKLNDAVMKEIEKKAQQFNVFLNIKHQPEFVKMTHWNPAADPESKQAIFSDCWLRERCHIVDKGRFYMCTRPPHFHTLFRGEKPFQDDGIVLHAGETLVDEMYQYLRRDKPLNACLYCYGGNAITEPHRIMNRGEITMVMEALR